MRSFVGVLAVTVASVAACRGDDGGDGRPVLTPRTLAEDPAVIADIAAREGLDLEAARLRAQQVAALAERHLERARPGAKGDDGAPLSVDENDVLPGVSAPREAHLLRAARSRVWLADVFEASHRAEDIPRAIVERADATTMPSHGTIQVVCNLVIGPTPTPNEAGDTADQIGPPIAKDDPEWRARVQRKADALAERLRRLVPDPGTERDCELFQRLVRLGLDVEPELDVSLRVESGGFESCSADRWDEGWVEAICPVSSPAWVGPFWTRFGAHVVAVVKVVEADEYEDTAREAKVRESILIPWRSSALGEQLGRMRRETGVRVMAPVAADEE